MTLLKQTVDEVRANETRTTSHKNTLAAIVKSRHRRTFFQGVLSGFFGQKPNFLEVPGLIKALVATRPLFTKGPLIHIVEIKQF
jgi:hypothetical protein